MKTLILNGSPRRLGDTAFLLSVFEDAMAEKCQRVDAYYLDFSPCIDCRGCWKTPGCVIQDGMSEVYRMIEESDNILIASPIYFGQLTGPLISLGSRLQAYYCAEAFQNRLLLKKNKKGAVLLVGGGDGKCDCARRAASIFLGQMGVVDKLPAAVYQNTNAVPARDSREAVSMALDIAKFFKERK